MTPRPPPTVIFASPVSVSKALLINGKDGLKVEVPKPKLRSA